MEAYLLTAALKLTRQPRTVRNLFFEILLLLKLRPDILLSLNGHYFQDRRILMLDTDLSIVRRNEQRANAANKACLVKQHLLTVMTNLRQRSSRDILEWGCYR